MRFLCVQQLLLLFNTFAVSSFQPAQQHQACDTPLSPWEIDNNTGVYVYSSFRTAKCFIYVSFQLISKDGENKAKDVTSPAFLLPSARVSPFLAGSVFHTHTRNSLVLLLLRKMRDNSLSEAPSTLMRFQLKLQRFDAFSFIIHTKTPENTDKNENFPKRFKSGVRWKRVVFDVDRWKHRAFEMASHASKAHLSTMAWRIIMWLKCCCTCFLQAVFNVFN